MFCNVVCRLYKYHYSFIMVLHELCSGVERISLDGKNTLPSLQLLEDQPQGRARRFPKRVILRLMPGLRFY